MKKAILFLLLALASCSNVFAQSECDVVLKGGIFNTTFLSSDANQKQTFNEWLCTTDFNSHNEAINAGVSVGVPIYGVPVRFGGTFSREEKDTWKHTNCSDRASSSEYSLKYSLLIRKVEPKVLETWLSCIKLINSFNPGLKCSLDDNDKINSFFSVKWNRLDDLDIELPVVKDSLIDGAIISLKNGQSGNELIQKGEKIQTTDYNLNLQRNGTSPIVLILNTTRGSCSIYSPAPELSYDVSATVWGSAEKPTPVSNDFHLDDGSPNCGIDEIRTTAPFCLPDVERITSVEGPRVSSSNCPKDQSQPIAIHYPSAQCITVDYHLKGCGQFLFDCRGRGWLIFDIRVNGVKYEKLALSQYSWTSQQSQNSYVIDYPYPVPGDYRNVKWSYKVKVIKKFGKMQETYELSENNPAVGSIRTALSNNGRLSINLPEKP
ncbi:MAG: hypothetical protein HQL03_02060 [Nitrospirae bacterium]|nr:hypothetical protein [Nitrospirota bacterium]MBF0592448.1 hypothetical protein [Nitrospirota bacterium]